MKIVIKQLVLLLLIVLFALGIYFGALLPLAKSQSFINAQRNFNTVQNTDDLKALYDVPLLMWAPIGQEEVVKFFAGTMVDIINGKNLDEQTARWLAEYIEPYLFKNDLRHLLILGDSYYALWRDYSQDENDFKKAEQYYLAAHREGPKIPIVLYRLAEMYAVHGELEKAKHYGELILVHWPDDARVRQLVNDINEAVSGSQKEVQ